MHRIRVGAWALVLAAAVVPPLHAQAPSPQARPCEQRAESKRLDFWVGTWDVVAATGKPAGHSVVQKILGDCVVFENWTNQGGGEGKSLNAYNPLLERWQQFWVDQYGQVTEYRESRWVGASLEYTARDSTAQGERLRRMTFTPIDSNTVRQLGELSTDGGVTWKLSYDLIYHRAH